MARPPIPKPLKRLVHELFPTCVKCGDDTDLQIAHIGDLLQVREAVGDVRLSRTAEAEWQAAVWNHPANVTRLCRSCETAYNEGSFTTDDLSALREAAAIEQGVGPIAKFFRQESLNAAPTHRGDVLAILYALDEMAKAWARGQWQGEWPTVFILRGGAAHGNYHVHVNVPEAATRDCTDDLEGCLATTVAWEPWRVP